MRHLSAGDASGYRGEATRSAGRRRWPVASYPTCRVQRSSLDEAHPPRRTQRGAPNEARLTCHAHYAAPAALCPPRRAYHTAPRLQSPTKSLIWTFSRSKTDKSRTSMAAERFTWKIFAERLRQPACCLGRCGPLPAVVLSPAFPTAPDSLRIRRAKWRRSCRYTRGRRRLLADPSSQAGGSLCPRGLASGCA